MRIVPSRNGARSGDTVIAATSHEPVTAAQQRMLRTLVSMSTREETKHPGSGGWVEWWDVANGWENQRMPLGFVANAASKVWNTLARRGFVEDHPTLSGLVRPTATALEVIS